MKDKAALTLASFITVWGFASLAMVYESLGIGILLAVVAGLTNTAICHEIYLLGQRRED